MEKFKNRYKTAKGEARAYVSFEGLKTLWFNTGTLCNLSCDNCYIESSPQNDRLTYLTVEDIKPFLQEIQQDKKSKARDIQIGLTGGEPFLNPSIIQILTACLQGGHEVLVLTNAFKVIKRWQKPLLELKNQFTHQLHLRVSLDHFTLEGHERERGEGTFRQTLEEIRNLYHLGFHLSLAGRSQKGESYDDALRGYRDLFKRMEIPLELGRDHLVIFPEMILGEDVPEITPQCWETLKKSPSEMMCAHQRMVVKKKGQTQPQVQACTLLAYSEEFNMAPTLKEAQGRVYLNHEFCSKFCVLGGANCSSTTGSD